MLNFQFPLFCWCVSFSNRSQLDVCATHLWHMFSLSPVLLSQTNCWQISRSLAYLQIPRLCWSSNLNVIGFVTFCRLQPTWWDSNCIKWIKKKIKYNEQQLFLNREFIISLKVSVLQISSLNYVCFYIRTSNEYKYSFKNNHLCVLWINLALKNISVWETSFTLIASVVTSIGCVVTSNRCKNMVTYCMLVSLYMVIRK